MYVDMLKVKQVLINLLSNVVKFIEDGIIIFSVEKVKNN